MLSGVATVAAAAAALSFASGYVGDGWPWEVATYLRLAQCAALGVTGALLLGLGRFRRGAVVTMCALVAMGTVLTAGAETGHSGRAVTTARAAASASGAPVLRIAVFNTGAPRGDVAAYADALRGVDPDLVVLPESRDIITELDARLDGLVALPVAEGSNPPAVLARRSWPVTFVDVTPGRSAVVVAAEADGRRVDVVAVHPLPPVTREWSVAHHRAIETLVTRVVPRPVPYVVAGDLNTTPWSPSMATLRSAGLRDATVTATFGAPLIGIPLDHVLTGPRVTTLTREVGPFAGSDHRLVVAEVAVGVR